jgi:diaminopropionate ammonia-lyase
MSWIGELLPNPLTDRASQYDQARREILCHEAGRRAQAEISTWPGYAPTPLHALPGLARRTGVGTILYKDESRRFGLGSFKALGGPYGVLRALGREIGTETPEFAVATSGARSPTVTCATAGNHGRAVAWGARMYGCRSIIFVPAVTSEHRAAAIAAFGAEVVRTSGDYDSAVRVAQAEASRNGWIVVSDTSYEGYEDIPRAIMQGYTVLVAEALDQLPGGRPPTHVFVQAGVGGLAAAVCAHLWEALGPDRPILTLVEPEGAACCLRSGRSGRPTTVPGPFDTMMGCLACGEPSDLAWRILREGSDFFLTITDDASAITMRRLRARSRCAVWPKRAAGDRLSWPASPGPPGWLDSWPRPGNSRVVRRSDWTEAPGSW